MQIIAPVIMRFGPRVQLSNGDIRIVGRHGKTKEMCCSKEVTGKGIFIAGTARSATVYITKVLNELGYSIGHEKNESDGSVGYHLAVLKPEHCLHQVRHPLKQIASMLTHQAWGFMNHIIDVYDYNLRGCMQYWLLWNELIEEFAVWRYRIEDLPDVWEEFLEKIGHEYEPIPDVSITTNSSRERGIIEKRNYKELEWNDLFDCNEKLAQQVYDKSTEYGYKDGYSFRKDKDCITKSWGTRESLSVSA